MLKTFRNIAATVVTWYVYSFAAGVLTYSANLLFGDQASGDKPGSQILLIVGWSLPSILVAVLAGALLMRAVKPRGTWTWILVLSAIVAGSPLVSELSSGPISDRPGEEFIGVVLVAALLLIAVLSGAGIARRRMFPRGPDFGHLPHGGTEE